MKKRITMMIVLIAALLHCYMLLLACGRNNSSHIFSRSAADDQYHFNICSECGEAYNKENHTFIDGSCVICGYLLTYTKNLNYKPIYDNDEIIAYTLIGMDKGVCDNIIVPSHYNGYPVTEIDNFAFCGNWEIKELTIGKNITKINSEAFTSCNNLHKVTLAENVIIEDMAFATCHKLETVEIPYGVKKIGERAFDGCENLKNISIPKSVNSIGRFAFRDTYDYINGRSYYDKSVYIDGCLIYADLDNDDNYKIKSNTWIIASGAFESCDMIDDLTMPKSINVISDDAFYGCCFINRIIYDGDISDWCNMYFGINKSNPLEFANNIVYNKISYGAQSYVEINCLEIPDRAFARNHIFYNIVIGDYVQCIGNNAFAYCDELTYLTIGKGIKKLCGYVFANCSKLKYIQLSDRLEYIDFNVFNNCLELSDIIFSGTLEQWSNIELDNIINGVSVFCIDGLLIL